MIDLTHHIKTLVNDLADHVMGIIFDNSTFNEFLHNPGIGLIAYNYLNIQPDLSQSKHECIVAPFSRKIRYKDYGFYDETIIPRDLEVTEHIKRLQCIQCNQFPDRCIFADYYERHMVISFDKTKIQASQNVLIKLNAGHSLSSDERNQLDLLYFRDSNGECCNKILASTIPVLGAPVIGIYLPIKNDNLIRNNMTGFSTVLVNEILLRLQPIVINSATSLFYHILGESKSEDAVSIENLFASLFMAKTLNGITFNSPVKDLNDGRLFNFGGIAAAVVLPSFRLHDSTKILQSHEGHATQSLGTILQKQIDNFNSLLGKRQQLINSNRELENRMEKAGRFYNKIMEANFNLDQLGAELAPTVRKRNLLALCNMLNETVIQDWNSCSPEMKAKAIELITHYVNGNVDGNNEVQHLIINYIPQLDCFAATELTLKLIKLKYDNKNGEASLAFLILLSLNAIILKREGSKDNIFPCPVFLKFMQKSQSLNVSGRSFILWNSSKNCEMPVKIYIEETDYKRISLKDANLNTIQMFGGAILFISYLAAAQISCEQDEIIDTITIKLVNDYILHFEANFIKSNNINSNNNTTDTETQQLVGEYWGIDSAFGETPSPPSRLRNWIYLMNQFFTPVSGLSYFDHEKLTLTLEYYIEKED